jgi:predicted Zn finger-like uncharacterized protein
MRAAAADFWDDDGMDFLRGNRQNRRPADGIRRVGFRKWYERELLSSHAYMILAILSFVAMAASFEAFNGGTMSEKLMNVLFVIVSAGIGLWALRRYLFLLMRAEEVANQARCGDCGEYGRFRVVAEDHSHQETQVRCSKCEHLWTICT